MTHTTTIVESAATEAGALDGWQVNCSQCGDYVAGFSIRSMCAEWAADHRRYMERVGR